MPVNWRHLGVLYCVDEDKVGHFTIENLRSFVQANKQSSRKDDTDLIPQLQAKCTIELWKSLFRGKAEMVEW